MADINTLVDDINLVLMNGLDDLPEDRIEEFNAAMGANLRRQFMRDHKPGLRMSNIGTPCTRKLWYSVNDPDNDRREVLRGDTRIKFMYGDLTEELILLLAELAGHDVIERQAEHEINGIKGHSDAVIDGCVVDVKSASTFAFKKFKEHRLLEDDPFGYIPQAMSYLYSYQGHPAVTDQDHVYFLAFDKQLGHICLDKYEKPDWFSLFPEMYERRKEMIAGDVPQRDFSPVPDGKSGNMKLDTYCSYCDFKHVCHPGLRVFLYSGGPRFLTEVVKEPDVYEQKT